ncbi:hypothetical protein CAE01nite_18500 [Cellulomonas aerilata]|uniref:O-antigen ligase-related domain-containing protein n=2 Tax=Cellulomonas aerilata TaxID=515326 RepID=A0A512DCE4_9CELL|nr:hypothetical protein CAE01nite_18500 [Cellulomonas aerilata]
MLLLGGWAFLLPVQLVSPLGLRVAPSDLLLLAYLGLRLPWLRRVPEAWSPWTHALTGALAVGLLVSLVRVGSVTSYALVQKGLGFGLLLLIYLCVVDAVRTWSDARWLLRAFLWGVLLHAAVALAAFGLAASGVAEVPLVNQPFPRARLAGLLVDPNAFGGLVALGLALHLMTVASSVPLLRGAAARSAGFVLPLALVLTFSRSAWIGFAVALVVAGAVAPRVAAVALVRTVAPLAVVLPVVVLTLVPDAAALVSRPDQVGARLSLAAGAVDDFVAYPLLGTGLGVNAATSENIVHNTALWTLAEMGLVGFVAFAGFALANAARMLAAARAVDGADRSLLLALLSAHAAMLGVSTGIEALYQRHWWLVLAVGGALVACSRRERW